MYILKNDDFDTRILGCTSTGSKYELHSLAFPFIPVHTSPIPPLLYRCLYLYLYWGIREIKMP